MKSDDDKFHETTAALTRFMEVLATVEAGLVPIAVSSRDGRRAIKDVHPTHGHLTFARDAVGAGFVVRYHAGDGSVGVRIGELNMAGKLRALALLPWLLSAHKYALGEMYGLLPEVANSMREARAYVIGDQPVGALTPR